MADVEAHGCRGQRPRQARAGAAPSPRQLVQPERREQRQRQGRRRQETIDRQGAAEGQVAEEPAAGKEPGGEKDQSDGEAAEREDQSPPARGEGGRHAGERHETQVAAGRDGPVPGPGERLVEGPPEGPGAEDAEEEALLPRRKAAARGRRRRRRRGRRRQRRHRRRQARALGGSQRMRSHEEERQQLAGGEAAPEHRGEGRGGQRQERTRAAAPGYQPQAGRDQAFGDGDLRVAREQERGERQRPGDHQPPRGPADHPDRRQDQPRAPRHHAAQREDGPGEDRPAEREAAGAEDGAEPSRAHGPGEQPATLEGEQDLDRQHAEQEVLEREQAAEHRDRRQDGGLRVDPRRAAAVQEVRPERQMSLGESAPHLGLPGQELQDRIVEDAVVHVGLLHPRRIGQVGGDGRIGRREQAMAGEQRQEERERRAAPESLDLPGQRERHAARQAPGDRLAEEEREAETPRQMQGIHARDDTNLDSWRPGRAEQV